MHNTECTIEGCGDQSNHVDFTSNSGTMSSDISAEFDSGDDSVTSDEDFIDDHEISDFHHEISDFSEENLLQDHQTPAETPSTMASATARIPENHSGEANSVNERDSGDLRGDIPTWTAKDLQKHSAQFLFGIKERYKLTQVAVQGIIEGTTSITQQCVAALKSKV